ncbi:hypothetical protein D9M68_541060 [compost metagenome]
MINTAYPYFNFTGFRFHGHHSGIHDLTIITNRIHCGKQSIPIAFVSKNGHLLFPVKPGINGIGLIGKPFSQQCINRQVFFSPFRIIHFISFRIFPGIFITPYVIKAALNNTHLVIYGLLRISLQLRVDGCINFQPVFIQVIIVFFTPFFKVFIHRRSQIRITAATIFHFTFLKL